MCDQSIMDSMFLAYLVTSACLICSLVSTIRINRSHAEVLRRVHIMMNYHQCKLAQAAKSGMTSMAIAALLDDFENQKQIIGAELNMPVKGE